MAYALRKKRYCVKQALADLTTISEICRNLRVPRRTLYRWKYPKEIREKNQEIYKGLFE